MAPLGLLHTCMLLATQRVRERERGGGEREGERDAWTQSPSCGWFDPQWNVTIVVKQAAAIVTCRCGSNLPGPNTAAITPSLPWSQRDS